MEIWKLQRLLFKPDKKNLGITNITEIKAFAIKLNDRKKIPKFEMEDMLIIKFFKDY